MFTCGQRYAAHAIRHNEIGSLAPENQEIRLYAQITGWNKFNGEKSYITGGLQTLHRNYGAGARREKISKLAFVPASTLPTRA